MSNETDPSFVHGVADCLQDIAGPEEKGVPRCNCPRPPFLVENEEMVFCYLNCSGLLWEKNCSSDREKLLKFVTEGQEFEIFLDN